jgi:hypothetical protein
MRSAGLALLLGFLVTVPSLAPPPPNPSPIDPLAEVDWEITSPDSKYTNVATTQILLWNIPVLADSGVSADQLSHVASVFAQYLDNNSDGCADDKDVVLRINQYTPAGPFGVIIFKDEAAYNTAKANDLSALADLTVLYMAEIETSCSGTKGTDSCFDATLSKVLYLLIHRGLGFSLWEVPNDSAIAADSDSARGGVVYDGDVVVPDVYGTTSTWANYDDTCDYTCQIITYGERAINSLLGVYKDVYTWRYVSNGKKCSTKTSTANGDVCEGWKSNTFDKMFAQQPNFITHLNSHPTLSCICKGKAIPPDGKYEAPGGILRTMADCADVTPNCLDPIDINDPPTPADPTPTPSPSGKPFPWLLVLIIVASLIVAGCCCYKAVIFHFENKGGTDRRTAPRAKAAIKATKYAGGAKGGVQMGKKRGGNIV